MNILIEEVQPDNWRVNVIPVTPEDHQAGMPSRAKLALVFVDLACDILKSEVKDELTDEAKRTPKLKLLVPQTNIIVPDVVDP